VIGVCECGCGSAVTVYHGRPRRFLHGHNTPRGRFAGVAGRNWKGGRSHTRNGYVRVWKPDHPNATKSGYILEHVLVAAMALRRAVPDGVEVHHVNGDKSENGGKNLVICPDRAYHALLHQRTEALRATGNPGALRCCYCKLWIMPDDPDLYLPPGLQSNARHRACAIDYQRHRRARLGAA
jgi:HNH endonuclease